MATQTGYVAGGSVSGGPTPASDQKDGDYWTLEQCKEAFLDYAGSKRDEQDETKQARRYRHGAQWTEKQINVLNDRRQPIVTYNRIGRKIDGIVGFVERLKQDPKAYPRTPQDQPSADLATAALRYVCDDQDWKSKTPAAAECGGVDGIGGIELSLKPTKTPGDYDLGFDLVSDGFFYDPSSVLLDFDDAGFNGVTRWLSISRAKQLYPQYANLIDEAATEAGSGAGAELSLNTDRDNRWWSFTGKRKFMRLVELWYRHNGSWCWALFTGSKKLDEGKSPFYIEDEQISKYIMFSAAVDHDGDRYGFVRNLKSAQDEINQRRSKGLHILNTRRIQGEIGAFPDIEEARKEAARPDGVVLRNKGFQAEFEDAAKQQELAGQFQFLEDAKHEVDNYGPSQILTGQGAEDQSGRAIALRQQAAVAELGPFVLSYRGWKIRVYRAIFSNISRYWTAQRWIRVTDDQNAPQFIPINAQQMDPATGQVQTVNSIGQLDVDIILDEGPDTINAMADTFETLREILPAVAPMLTPPQAQTALEIVFDTSPLPGDAKKKFRDAGNAQAQPNPMQQQAAMLQLQEAAAKVRDTNAAAGLKQAQTQKTLVDAQLAPQEQQHDQAMDKANLIQDAAHAFMDRGHDNMNQQHDRHLQVVFKAADQQDAQAERDFTAQQSDADRAVQARQPAPA